MLAHLARVALVWALTPPPPRQDEELREFFVPFGTVEDAVVIMERDDPGRSRGFGFVTYAPRWTRGS